VISDECIHGLGPIEACVLCNGRAKREAEAETEDVRIIEARYEGDCAHCHLPIRVGDRIAWKSNARPLHEECR
jgi:hypothetical protein